MTSPIVCAWYVTLCLCWTRCVFSRSMQHHEFDPTFTLSIEHQAFTLHTCIAHAQGVTMQYWNYCKRGSWGSSWRHVLYVFSGFLRIWMIYATVDIQINTDISKPRWISSTCSFEVAVTNLILKATHISFGSWLSLSWCSPLRTLGV